VAAARASGGSGPLPDLSTLDYDAVRELALGCTRCGLAESRTQVVFSDGNPGARLVVVGEAPGANEDQTGLPFVGQAGRLLDLMLASVGLSREESVYICNVLKCRPPGNRNPSQGEIATCSPFLLRQLELVQPEALLAVGTFSAQLLTSSDIPIGKLRGQVHSYQGIPLVVTYHPAALLRNSGWTRLAWDDLQLLRQVMD
jgi:DNA polymerase